jgi:hypothetical protein
MLRIGLSSALWNTHGSWRCSVLEVRPQRQLDLAIRSNPDLVAHGAAESAKGAAIG